MKVPNLERLISQYEHGQARKGLWTADPNVFNQCLECGRNLMEHDIMTIFDSSSEHVPEIALVCPDYVDKYRRAKLLHETVTFIG